tara:strand:+ start:1709 stop:2044 length:336 start_codon:yes stop_codon:yes gene_type:complete
MKKSHSFLLAICSLALTAGTAAADIRGIPGPWVFMPDPAAEETAPDPCSEDPCPYGWDDFVDWSLFAGETDPYTYGGSVNRNCQAFIPQCGYSEEEIYFAEHGRPMPNPDD